MILYISIAVITVVMACAVRHIPDTVIPGTGTYPGGVKRQQAVNAVVTAAIFVILFLLAALRREVGNDYGTYVVNGHEVYQHGYVVTEPGYNLLVRILYTLSGSENYLLLFAVFAAAITALFLNVFRTMSDSFVLSFFMFMTMGIYFRTFNTVRYYFVLALALYSMRYVINISKENAVKFILIILVAALFHKSVLIVIPMYLLARLPWRKWMYIAVAGFAIIMPLCSGKVMELALKLYPSYVDTVYAEQQHSITENLPVVAGCVAVIALCLVFYKSGIRYRADNKMYFHMSIMAIALYIGCYFLPLVTRLGYYLVTPQLLLIPNILSTIEDNDRRRRITAIVVTGCILYFMYFLYTADRVGVRVLPYKSFLFYDRYWLNQTDTF